MYNNHFLVRQFIITLLSPNILFRKPMNENYTNIPPANI